MPFTGKEKAFKYLSYNFVKSESSAIKEKYFTSYLLLVNLPLNIKRKEKRTSFKCANSIILPGIVDMLRFDYFSFQNFRVFELMLSSNSCFKA